ncbi:MAG: glycosyltransferase family 4 protein [Steroidobacteraceae bacterium]
MSAIHIEAGSQASVQPDQLAARTRPLRVLYLHFVGQFGGASRSLYEVVRSFPPGSVEPLFVTQRGTVKAYFAQLGPVIEAAGLTKIDNTRYSYYRGVRWLVVLRELAYLPATAAALYRARRRWREVDLIHVNEFSGLITLWLARRWFDAPAVVHVRAVLRDAPRSLRTRWINRMLKYYAQGVIAIDENVRASLPSDLRVEVIHNGFSPKPAGDSDAALERRLARLRPESFKVGFVGNLMLAKGIHEFIEAARLTRDWGLDVEFLIIGDDARPSRGLVASVLKLFGLEQNVRSGVESALQRHALRDRVHLVGFTQDLARVFRHMHVVAFPSHYDAPGRPIFEAAFFAVPSIVAVREPRPDTLIDNETGLAIEPKSAEQLARAIERMARDRQATLRMGEAARQMAERNFNAQANAARLLQLYYRVTGREAS